MMVKVQFNIEQAMEAQMGSRGIVLLFHLALDGVWVVKATRRPLYPVPIAQVTGWGTRQP